MNIGFDYEFFLTERFDYYCTDDICALNITLSQSGIVEMKEFFEASGTESFISSEMLDDEFASIVKKDGFIIVSVTADEEELAIMGDNIASCIETYTIDATTREMVSVKTAYTFTDGTAEEGVVTIIRDTEMPEGMKKFVEYDQESENLRTVTIVSNPGTENEKTESIQIAKGLQFSVSSNFDVEENFGIYTDAACTQPFEVETDLNADLTVYVKWGE
jgi:hypothetical protein